MRTRNELQHAYNNALLTGEDRNRVIREYVSLEWPDSAPHNVEGIARMLFDAGRVATGYEHTGFEAGAL